MDAHIAEVAAEAALHQRAHGGIEWPAWRAQRLVDDWWSADCIRAICIAVCATVNYWSAGKFFFALAAFFTLAGRGSFAGALPLDADLSENLLIRRVPSKIRGPHHSVGHSIGLFLQRIVSSAYSELFLQAYVQEQGQACWRTCRNLKLWILDRGDHGRRDLALLLLRLGCGYGSHVCYSLADPSERGQHLPCDLPVFVGKPHADIGAVDGPGLRHYRCGEDSAANVAIGESGKSRKVIPIAVCTGVMAAHTRLPRGAALFLPGEREFDRKPHECA